MEKGLVYVGKIVTVNDILDADHIASATVVCGAGGKWRGVIRKIDFKEGDLCLVYLPDALVPETDEMRFLASSGWRVKMRRFRGSPSEVVIMGVPKTFRFILAVGEDITLDMGVCKYHKPVPTHLQGMAKGFFPGFIPKTDELNYQRYGELVNELVGQPYYITEKADGSSTTAFRYKGEFGLCSRNLELERNEANGYWQVAKKYGIEEKLPEGLALQWETCGPGIQSNPMGLKEIDGFAFTGYNIAEHRYMTVDELITLCDRLGFPMVPILESGKNFKKEGLELLGEGRYANGKEREGVVVRSQYNIGSQPISFKVINLGYEK